MRIAVAREADSAEDRVAATPDTVKKLKGLGAEVTVEPGAASAASLANGYVPFAPPKSLFHADFPGNPRVVNRSKNAATGRPTTFA